MRNQNSQIILIFHNFRFFSFLLILSLISCRDLVQDDFPDFMPIPTVNSILIADSTIQVHVSLAEKMDTTSLKGVDNAEVKLFINNTFTENLVPVGDGCYHSTSTVEPGKTYQCKVHIAGFGEVTCSDSLPTPNSILSTEHVATAGINQDGLPYSAIKFTFRNTTGEHRYYQAVIWQHTGRWQPATLEEITDPIILSEGLPIAVFSNDQIKGDSCTITLNYSTGSSYSGGNTLPCILELRSISFDYYQYIRQLYLYNLGRFPEFLTGSGNVFSLHSNVRNGYGIFAGYSSCLSEIINPNQPSL
ncbi:MAG: DUF4249 domain-containing protein [Bacteroidales bacterium]|nr:DUF4249 domain-containing protein [Bacteroidales bacterium]